MEVVGLKENELYIVARVSQQQHTVLLPAGTLARRCVCLWLGCAYAGVWVSTVSQEPEVRDRDAGSERGRFSKNIPHFSEVVCLPQ